MNKTRWEQIETIYHAALEQPPEGRANFLSDKCNGDEELIREVQSLLSSNEKEDNFLSEPEFNLGLRVLAKPHQVLKQNQIFGNYKVLDFLGRGGMGEVYLAEDSRLGRFIALKVLPADVALDEKRIQRFMQEARAASALNHPNILTIHDIGESDGWHFIASEFVEGETLRERLKREKRLAPQETIEIALQIAAALSAAHKAGIIHRDIKPENLMLREDGLVKVLDFGLAKLTENFSGPNSDNNFSSTTPGMVMGTVAYMSPEQVRGQKTDERSDIWSFGVCLYEMINGKPPFVGDTTSDKIAAILTSEPILSEKHSREKPQNLRQIIGKALSKNPEARYQTAKELADDLRKMRADSEAFSENDFFSPTDYKQIEQTDSKIAVTSDTLDNRQTDVIEKKSVKNKGLFAFASVLFLVSAGGYAAFNYLNISNLFSREPMKITRVFDTGKTVTAAISPDGKYVVHALGDAGKESIWIKHIATNSNVQLVAPKEVDYPAMTFSKDGNYIYYVQNNGELYQIPVLGGESKKISASVHSAISFSPDGRQFVFVRSLSSDETALIIANADGSGEYQLATRKKPEFFVGPAWSPDGKVIACSTSGSGSDPTANIVEIPIEGGAERIISPQKWRAILQTAWLSDGSGLIAPAVSESGNDLLQLWFFPTSGGEAHQITNELINHGDVSLTADANTLVTIRSEQRSNIWRLPQGRTEEAGMVSNNVHALYRFIAWSPDGRIIYTSQADTNEGRNIWIMNADGSNAKQLTANAGDNILPCASGDGRYIVFASNRADLKTYHIWRMNIHGSEPVQLTSGGGARSPKSSPDGQTIYYLSGGPDVGPEKSRLWKISVNGGEAVQLNDYPTGWFDVSPDGKFVAARIKPDANAPFKLGIIPPDGGKPVKIFDFNFSFNSQVRWKPDGSAITFFKTENGVSNIWEQSVEGGPARPLTKFTAELILGFDWSKDGNLFCTRSYETRDPVLISNFR